MNKKVVLFAFNGDPMCFVHVMLTAIDMKRRGFDVKVVIEGSATKLIADMAREGAPFGDLYKDFTGSGFVDCVCKACANKMGVLEAVQEQGFYLCYELSGHPSMGRYIESGYEVITF